MNSFISISKLWNDLIEKNGVEVRKGKEMEVVTVGLMRFVCAVVYVLEASCFRLEG